MDQRMAVIVFSTAATANVFLFGAVCCYFCKL